MIFSFFKSSKRKRRKEGREKEGEYSTTNIILCFVKNIIRHLSIRPSSLHNLDGWMEGKYSNSLHVGSTLFNLTSISLCILFIIFLYQM